MGVPEPISIHAPLTGCDLRSVHQDSGTSYFNPRTPCGVRRQFPNGTLPTAASFQSMHPSRGATPFGRTTERLHVAISIHAPLAGCDQPARCSSRQGHHFNPRTPCGVRRLCPLSLLVLIGYFNPRTPRGVRLREQNFLRFLVSFQSTHPLRGATAPHPADH